MLKEKEKRQVLIYPTPSRAVSRRNRKMGVCGSQEMSPEAKKKLQEESKKNEEFARKMEKNKNASSRVHKLLLLGAGESGKSTLFKQMILIYGTDEKEKDTIDNRKNYIELIYQNIIHNAKVLAEACVNPAIGGNPAIAGEPRTPEAQAALTWIEEVDDDNFRLDAFGASHLKMFWRDPGIQNTYDNRALFQLNDSTAYFMQQIDRVILFLVSSRIFLFLI
jgi:hypothetical protein